MVAAVEAELVVDRANDKRYILPLTASLHVPVHGCRFTGYGFFQRTYAILEAFGCWFRLLAFFFQIQPSRERPMTSFNMLFFLTGNRQLQTVNGYPLWCVVQSRISNFQFLQPVLMFDHDAPVHNDL